MQQSSVRSIRIPLIVAAVLVLAALACSVDTGSGGGATAVPVGGTTGGGSTTGGTTGGTTTGGGSTTGGGATTGGVEPTKEPKPAGGGINASNVANLKEKQNITASGSLLMAGGLSPTSHQGATFDTERLVRFFDVDSGKLLYELPGHADTGFGLAYSPDGKVLATGGGFQIKFWDTSSGADLGNATPNAIVYRLTFSPDSKTLAVVGERSSKIDLIDVASAKVTKRISTESGNVLWAVAYSPDGELLAVADFKDQVTVFDGAGNGGVKWMAQGKGAAWDMEVSPDGKLLTTCTGSGDIYTWSLEDGSQYPNLTKTDVHTNGCLDGVFTPNSEVYFSIGADNVLTAWDVKTGDALFTKQYSVGFLTVSVSGDGSLLGLAMGNGDFRILGLD